jgi:hypothetical protein
MLHELSGRLTVNATVNPLDLRIVRFGSTWFCFNCRARLDAPVPFRNTQLTRLHILRSAQRAELSTDELSG